MAGTSRYRTPSSVGTLAVADVTRGSSEIAPPPRWTSITCSTWEREEPRTATSPITAYATGMGAPEAYVIGIPLCSSVAQRTGSLMTRHVPSNEHDAPPAPNGRLCNVVSSHFDVAPGSFVPN